MRATDEGRFVMNKSIRIYVRSRYVSALLSALITDARK